MVNKEFFTAKETAKRLGISKQTLFRYEKKGIFPKARRSLINRWRQYTKEDLNRLIKIIRGDIE